MCMTYYTVDDLRPGSPGWDVSQFSALAEAIEHYRTLPMDGTRVLGMADDAHAYELIRCVRLFPGDAQGEDVLAADYRRSGLTKKNAALKNALDVCLEVLHPRFLLEPERLVPVPHRRKMREELREALLWQGYEGKLRVCHPFRLCGRRWLDLTPGRKKAAAASTCAELPGRWYDERWRLPFLRIGALRI